MKMTEMGQVIIRPDRIAVDVSVAETERQKMFIHVQRTEADYTNQDPPIFLTYTEAEELAGLLLKAAVKARHHEYITDRRHRTQWARRVAEKTGKAPKDDT